ncbi:MAG TPA: 5-(carboxyamino)imidazole ribonucleotide synthase [Planctomycetota bacterium]|nr:5-(carboxyamino)imidazole ribonucleotide synthase [Planctomycetota bacterium]
MKIGVLGAGQLGRMLALHGFPLGMRFRFFDPTAKGPANDLAEQHAEDYRSAGALKSFAQGLDAVTYEFENVPVESARLLAECVPHVFPPPEALEASQDRFAEKTLFNSLGIPTAPFCCVENVDALRGAVEQFGLPAILKTRRMGYDGKGQFVIRNESHIDEAFRELGGRNLILEGFVDFDRELSILAARNRSGQTVFYPLVENVHEGGILRVARAPAPNLTPAMQPHAEELATRVLNALNYDGVLAIELFEKHGNLVANEMACRVHNSGHWTIEGAETSQFENHLRAGLDYPLGSAHALGYTVMLNLIGTVPVVRDILSVKGAHLHLYNKAPKPGRKLGHITVVGENPEEREVRLQELMEVMGQEISNRS